MNYFEEMKSVSDGVDKVIETALSDNDYREFSLKKILKKEKENRKCAPT